MGFSHRSNQSRHWCLCLLALCWDVSKMLTFLLHWDSMGYYTCNWLVDASHYSTVCRYSVIIHFSGSSWVLIPTSCVRGRGFRATSRINKGQIYLKVPVFPVCSQFKASLVWWLCFHISWQQWFQWFVGFRETPVAGSFRKVLVCCQSTRGLQGRSLGDFLALELYINLWETDGEKKALPSGNDWHSYWTWPFIVDVPIVNGDFP